MSVCLQLYVRLSSLINCNQRNSTYGTWHEHDRTEKMYFMFCNIRIRDTVTWNRDFGRDNNVCGFMEILGSLPCFQEPAQTLQDCCKLPVFKGHVSQFGFHIFKFGDKKILYLANLCVRSACTVHLAVLLLITELNCIYFLVII